MEEVIVRQPRGGSRSTLAPLWGVLLVVWILMMCLLPDPRPLGAPDWAVSLFRKLLGVGEPSARAAATFTLRATGAGLLGLLLALAVSGTRFKIAVPVILVGGPLLAIGCLWVNYGYFPLFFQWQIASASAIVGGLAGLALRESLAAKIAFVVVTGGLFLWGTATGISNDVDESARITGFHILSQIDEFPKGDEGFTAIVQEAFRFAEDNSHRTDAVHTNKAVIVALGVILGENRIAQVAHREMSGQFSGEIRAARRKVLLRKRGDLPRHFWVSAALTVLSDQDRSITVGLTKELMDANPGGSGFSFVDLMADEAGSRFAFAATRDDASARWIQQMLRGEISTSDFLPPIEGIPEGLPLEQFEGEYGGLKGEGTDRVVQELLRRLDGCSLLSPPL